MKIKELNKIVLSPNGSEANHIKSVEVYSGPDDYEEVQGLELTSDPRGRISCTPQKKSGPVLGRYRGEPCVKINIAEESGPDNEQANWYLIIYHHKGAIKIRRERMANLPVEQYPHGDLHPQDAEFYI